MPGDFEDRLAAVDDALDAPDAAASDRRRETGDGGVREVDSGGSVSSTESAESAGSTVSGGESEADSASGGSSTAGDVAALTERVAELEAAVQALRGYAGSVRAVNDRVEERADAAVASTEGLRERVAELERRSADGQRVGRGEERAAGGDGRTGRDGARSDASRGAPRRTSAAAGREDEVVPDEGGSSGRGRGSTSRERGSPAGERGSSVHHEASSTSEGESGVAWPPESPREPYGDVDDDDDRERPGLVARLRERL